MAKSNSSDRAILDHCRSELARVSALLEQRDYERARSACVRILTDIDQHGHSSCTAFRLYAVALDYLGHLREALAAVERALEVDPLSPDADRSRDLILSRLRQSIVAPAPELTMDEVLRRYDALRDQGEASVDVHMAVASMHLARGARQDARKILAAVATLHPQTIGVWDMLDELGRTDGNVNNEPAVTERRATMGAEASLESAYDKLYDDICSIGSAVAEAGGFELPDEWPNLIRDWLIRNQPGILARGVTEADVQEALRAQEIGAPAEAERQEGGETALIRSNTGRLVS